MTYDPEDEEIVRKKPIAFCYSIECIKRVHPSTKKETRVYSKVIVDAPFGRNMCPYCKHALVWGNEDDIIKYPSRGK